MPRGHHTHRGVPTPEGGERKRRVTVRFNNGEIARIDAARGAEARGVYLRRTGLDCAKSTTGDNGPEPTDGGPDAR